LVSTVKLFRWQRRGIAPVIMGIAAIIFGVLAIALVATAPTIADYILNQFGGEESVYFFLIEIPTADENAPGIMTSAITNVFDLLRYIALLFFAVVLLIAGLYYALESFRLVSEGTAASIVTGSVFTALMIYLFIPIYNVIGGLLNLLTSPEQGLILTPGAIGELLHWAIKPQTGGVTDQMLAFFLSVFFLVMVVATLISIAILGILRIFFLGAIVAMMPILLVLRLIPVTRRMAESFIDMLIGLMLSSLVASIFIRFGYEALTTGSFTGLAGTIVAWGTLLAASMMPTVLAPRLGSLFMTTTGMVTAAVSSAVIGTVGTLSGTAIGTVLGARAVTGPGASSLSRWDKATGFLRTVGYAAGPFTAGMLSGRFAGAIPTIGSLPSLGGVQGAISASRKQVSVHMDQMLQNRAGTVTEALISALPFTPASPLASEADGRAWQEKIKAMSDEQAGDFFLEHFPRIKLLEKYKGSAGREFKRTMTAVSPLLASSIIGNLKKYKEDEKLREFFIKSSLENLSVNRDKLKAHGYPVPDVVDEADASPMFMRDIFRYGGETAKIVNAKLFHGALSHYDPKMPLEEARKAANNFVRNIFIDPETGEKRTNEKIAEELAKRVGINNLTSEEKKVFGYTARKYLTTLQKDAPRILAAAWKATSDPKWTERIKSQEFTEAALKRVESGDLQNSLSSIALANSREIWAEKATEKAAEMADREREMRDALKMMFQPPVSLKHLFPEEQPTTEPQQPKVNLGEFFKQVDRELKKRKGSGYTPPKPRKRGIVVAKGFGGEFSASLQKFMKKKKRQGEG